MSRKRQMIELSAPSVLRGTRCELFVVRGFTCPICAGNGWGWSAEGPRENTREMHGGGRAKVTCPTCGGTGELDAEVSVRWRTQKGGAA